MAKIKVSITVEVDLKSLGMSRKEVKDHFMSDIRYCTGHTLTGYFLHVAEDQVAYMKFLDDSPEDWRDYHD